MTWSSAGSVATYPTVQPAKGAALAACTLTLRADPNSGVVYVTGGVATSSTASGAVIAAPLAAAFRPQAPVALTLTTSSTAAANPTLTINPDGTLALGGTPTSTSFTVRTFYFTNVTPG